MFQVSVPKSNKIEMTLHLLYKEFKGIINHQAVKDYKDLNLLKTSEALMEFNLLI